MTRKPLVVGVVAACAATLTLVGVLSRGDAGSVAAASGVGNGSLSDLSPADVTTLKNFEITLTPLAGASVPPRVTKAMLQAHYAANWTKLNPSSITYDYVLYTDPRLTAKVLHASSPAILADDPALAHMQYVANLPTWMVTLHGVTWPVFAKGTSVVTDVHYMIDAYSGQWLGTWTN